MGRKAKHLDIEPEQLAEMYRTHGTVDDLARALGVGKSVLRRALDAAGIEVKRGRPAGTAAGGRPAKLRDEYLAEMVAMYDEHGTMAPIAKRYGVTRQAVSQFFARNGIDIDRSKPLPSTSEVTAAWYDSRNASEVAAKLHIAVRLAREALDLAGLTFPSIAATPRQVDGWVARYHAGLSLEALAESAGVHPTTMKRALRAAGVTFPTRSKKSAPRSKKTH